MTLPYRALLIDPEATDARPKQSFATSREEIDKWAVTILTKTANSKAVVEIYESTETKIATVEQPRKEPSK